MCFYRFLGAITFVIVIFPQDVLAQNQLVVQRLDKENAEHPTLSRADAKSAIFEKVKMIAESKGQCVPTNITVEAPAAITGDPFLFPMVLAGNVKNVWRVYAQYEGCNNDLVQRFALIDNSDDKRIAVPINPGRSLTTVKLMRDTSPSAGLQAAAAARRQKPDCDAKDMELISTHVTSESKDLGPEIYGVRYVGSWTESWRLKTCGLVFDVPITFSADGDGGAYTNINGDAVLELVAQQK
jgi:hypothetical protein